MDNHAKNGKGAKAKDPRGGKRARAGRKRGRPDIATFEDKQALALEARKYAGRVIKQLFKIASKGESEAAQVTACNSILDRAFGKAPQSIEHTGPSGGPVQHEHSVDSLRTKLTNRLAGLADRIGEHVPGGTAGAPARNGKNGHSPHANGNGAKGA